MSLDNTTIVNANLSTGGNKMTTTTTSTEPIKHIAKCGHEDSLGYFTNTPCGKCVRKAHKKATRR